MRMNRPRAVTTSVLAAAVASLTALFGCYEPTEPYHTDDPDYHTDIDLAREAWLATHPLEYTFEVARASSWFAESGYKQVEVSEGIVVSATDPNGRPIEGFSLTLDTLWTYALTARTSGELNSALFDSQGVPIEVDWGRWEVDGGVRYRVQDFARLR